MSEQKTRTVLQEFKIDTNKLSQLLLDEEKIIEENILKACKLCVNHDGVFPIGFNIPKLPLLPKFPKTDSFNIGDGQRVLNLYTNEPYKSKILVSSYYVLGYSDYLSEILTIKKNALHFIYNGICDTCLPSQIEKDFNKVINYRKKVEKWYSDYNALVYSAYGKFYTKEESFVDRICKWLMGN